jgi:hypothetical protein
MGGGRAPGTATGSPRSAMAKPKRKLQPDVAAFTLAAFAKRSVAVAVNVPTSPGSGERAFGVLFTVPPPTIGSGAHR